MKIYLYLMFLLCLCGCKHSSGTEIHQVRSDEIINVKDRLQEIVIDTPLIGSWSRPYIMDDYLIINDHQSQDNQILIFNKNNFSFLAATGHKGEGPNQLTIVGTIVPDVDHHKFYVSDHGKQVILSYDMDSVLTNLSYLPERKTSMERNQFPDRYVYINDTLCIARSILVKENEAFQQTLVKWNMKTGEVHSLINGHPKIERKRSNFAVSLEDSLIVECYTHHDLMTIHDFNGNLKHNIYGSHWDSHTSNEMVYYGDVLIYKNKIVATYAGGHNWTDEQFPTCLLIFDLEGNYIKTLNVGYKICHICCDQDNNRIFMVLEDLIQFACLDLNGLL